MFTLVLPCTMITTAPFFLLDVCDPSWRITRDGLFISGFVASIVSFILAVFVVWIHVYSNYDGEELHNTVVF